MIWFEVALAALVAALAIVAAVALLRLVVDGFTPTTPGEWVSLLVLFPLAWLGAISGVVWVVIRPVVLPLVAALVEGFDRGSR